MHTRGTGIEKWRRGLTANVMIASANAITLDGKLVNLDGMGNRVASMIFGHEKVILAVGMNKVAADLETAMARVRYYAAPVNAIRLGLKNPLCGERALHRLRVAAADLQYVEYHRGAYDRGSYPCQTDR